MWSHLSVVRPLEYLFLCARRKFVSNKKICRKLLRPVLSLNYSGTILRYYFVAGAEIDRGEWCKSTNCAQHTRTELSTLY